MKKKQQESALLHILSLSENIVHFYRVYSIVGDRLHAFLHFHLVLQWYNQILKICQIFCLLVDQGKNHK